MRSWACGQPGVKSLWFDLLDFLFKAGTEGYRFLLCPEFSWSQQQSPASWGPWREVEHFAFGETAGDARTLWAGGMGDLAQG